MYKAPRAPATSRLSLIGFKVFRFKSVRETVQLNSKVYQYGGVLSGRLWSVITGQWS